LEVRALVRLQREDREALPVLALVAEEDRLRHLLVPRAEDGVVFGSRGGRLVRDDPVPDPMIVEVFAQLLGD
jgi:hypothetical protein